jgi:hypothetical protein
MPDVLRHPDSTGTALIGGVEYWVSCWRREAKSGQRYLALSFKPKIADARQKNEATKAAGAAPFNDTIPFGPEFR